MKTTLKAAMLAAVLCSGTPATLAAELTSESRSVDARTVNLNLDGVISVKVKQGPVASLTLYGKPEALKHNFAGYWSRRITDEHRLAYKVTDDEIRIAACRYRYG